MNNDKQKISKKIWARKRRMEIKTIRIIKWLKVYSNVSKDKIKLAKILEIRTNGLTYNDIAKKVNASISTVWKICKNFWLWK
jgi:predicted transcriptional regulator